MRVTRALIPKVIYPMTVDTHYHAETHNLAKRVIVFIRHNQKVHLRLNELRKFLKNNNIQIMLLQKSVMMRTFKALLQNRKTQCTNCNNF